MQKLAGMNSGSSDDHRMTRLVFKMNSRQSLQQFAAETPQDILRRTKQITPGAATMILRAHRVGALEGRITWWAAKHGRFRNQNPSLGLPWDLKLTPPENSHLKRTGKLVSYTVQQFEPKPGIVQSIDNNQELLQKTKELEGSETIPKCTIRCWLKWHGRSSPDLTPRKGPNPRKHDARWPSKKHIFHLGTGCFRSLP